jgi:serine protease Do
MSRSAASQSGLSRRGRTVAGAVVGAIAVAGLALAPMATAFPAWARVTSEGFGEIVDQVGPAVVAVTATGANAVAMESEGAPEMPEHFRDGPFRDFFERFFEDGVPDGSPQSRGKQAALGSGFIIDASGIVVTNNHVIGNAKDVTVTLRDGRELKAERIGADEKTDLAVLKVNADKPLPAAAWGNSETARVGDWVVAVGNPFGLGGTATAGIISARGRDLGSGPYDDFIQIDAPINRGNSGGPLFNREGHVIGVNTAIYSPNGGSVGIGFAVPSQVAQKIVAELREKGKVDRGWLGVGIQPVTDDVANAIGLAESKGALVASVTPNSPADRAGVRVGDVILSFNGKDVTSSRDLARIVADTGIGARTEVRVWRGEKTVALQAAVGEAPQRVAAAAGAADADTDLGNLGVTLANVDDRMRARYRLGEDAEGALVAGVGANTDAAQKGLRPGDLITRVNNQAVRTPDDVRRAVRAAADADRKVVLLLVERQGEGRFVAVELAHA